MANKKEEKDNQNWSAKDKTLAEISQLYGKRKQLLLQKDSPAEDHFEQLLREQRHYYIRERAFMEDGFLCYVDFFIPFYNIAIEIDGKEHQTKKGKYRDEVKADFLLHKRGVKTYRITNEQCMEMTSVNIDEINEKVWDKDKINEWFTIRMPAERKIWYSQVQPKTKFDLSKPIFAYSKLNDKTYEFADCYIMRKCTDMNNCDLIRNLENQESFLPAVNFIIANDEETLQKRMVEYFNHLIKSKKKSHAQIKAIARNSKEDVCDDKLDKAFKELAQLENTFRELRRTSSIPFLVFSDCVLTHIEKTRWLLGRIKIECENIKDYYF